VGAGLPITPLADGGDNRALMSASGQLSRLGTMLAVLGGLLSLLAGLSAGVGDSAAFALRLTAVKRSPAASALLDALGTFASGSIRPGTVCEPTMTIPHISPVAARNRNL
jgi:hypothetical protein